MTDALRNLIEAVEAGKWTVTHWRDFRAVPTTCDVEQVFVATLANSAYHGSLDAAKALHDELLPGWEWKGAMSNFVVWLPNGKDGAPRHGGMSSIAARAWLLAILRAKLAEGGSDG